MRTWVVLLILTLPAAMAAEPLQSSGPVHTTALAVAETSTGFVGLSSQVEARVLGGGSGQVFVDTKPLSETDMQASARLAARVAAETLGLRWDDYDYLMVMRSGSSIIGGPSAGGIMSLAFATALHNLAVPDDPWTLDPTVAATGTINADGTIGPVGGIPAKVEGAAAIGIRTVLYPAGQDQATTQTLVDGVVRTVVVDLQAHCADLGLTCRPATTLRDLIAAAAGVRIAVPDVPVPDTSGYAGLIGPSVQDQVDALQAAIAAVPDLSALSDHGQAAVQDRLDQARSWSDQARQALDEGRYYQAATFSFRGAIQARAAADAWSLYDSGETQTAKDAVQACQDDADAALDAVKDRSPDDLTGWLAVGAAQVRAVEGLSLADQAVGLVARAFTASDWLDAVDTAAFCQERAASVHWWAGLADTFPAGSPLGDADALVQDVLDRAREATTYAQAVGVDLADSELQTAQDLADAGMLPGATVQAVVAETDAGLALQSAPGDIPAETLAAALDTASRAVQSARAAGSEPVLSVSLIELAGTAEDDADALSSYWQARSLALLAPVSPSQAAYSPIPVHAAGDGMVAFAFVMGFIAASGLAMLVFVFATIVRPSRR